jgi:hypothetical protein
MAARAQVRRFGGNVNQAVAALNSTGETPQWLAQAVELTSRAVRQVDAAASSVSASRLCDGAGGTVPRDDRRPVRRSKRAQAAAVPPIRQASGRPPTQVL